MQIVKKKTVWIDIFKPNQKDIENIKRIHPIHPVILEELLHPSSRGYVENHKSYLFIVYHVPVYDPIARTCRRAEIDFLILKNILITIRYEPMEQVDTFLSSLASDDKLQKEVLSEGTYLPLYRILEEMTKFSHRQLRHIEDQVSYIAKEIFRHKEDEMLRQISYVKRNILDYRLISRPHQHLFESLQQTGEEFWGDKSKAYLADLRGESLRNLQNLENYFETIESLETTNSQILEARTGEILKFFTVGAFLFSIPFLYIFMLDIKYIGDVILASPIRFWSTFLIMIAGVGALALWLRKKRML